MTSADQPQRPEPHRHFSLDTPPKFCEVCGKRWRVVVDGRDGRSRRREMPGHRAIVREIEARRAAERERDLAIAHDRQPYPTAAAYEAVCAARDKWQALAEATERTEARYREVIERARRTNVPAATLARKMADEDRDSRPEQPAPLDVERLAEALDAVLPGLRGETVACEHGSNDKRYWPLGDPGGDIVTPGDFAARVAAEYADASLGTAGCRRAISAMCERHGGVWLSAFDSCDASPERRREPSDV